MPLFYVTGISGSGKSATLMELRHRGYEAHGIDEDGLAFFYNNETGEQFANDIPAEARTPEWTSQHSWKASPARIKHLADASKDKPVFVCGSALNDDEIWPFFAKVFALTVDEPTLKHRITTRTTNDYGKNPHEFKSIMRWQAYAKEQYTEMGAILIDALQPVEKVADDIVAATKTTG
jgi:thymidylate kinase